MTNFQKKKLFFAIPLIVFVIAVVYYFSILNNKNNYSSALISVPQNSYFTLGIEDISSIVNDLSNNQIIRSYFSNDNSTLKLNNILNLYTVLFDNSFFNKKLKDAQLFISLVPNENNFDFLFSFQLGSSIKNSSFFSSLNEIKNDLGIKDVIQNRSSNEFQIVLNSKSDLLFGFLNSSTLLLSENSNLVNEAAKRMQDENISIPEHWKNYSSSGNYKIYYQADRLKQFFSIYVDEQFVPLNLIPDNAVVDVSFNDASVSFLFNVLSQEVNIESFKSEQYNDVLAKILNYSFIGFSYLESSVFNNNGLLSNQFVEILFDIDPGDEVFPLMKVFKVSNSRDFKKFVSTNSKNFDSNNLKPNIPDSLKVGKFNKQIFNSSYFKFEAEHEYYIFYDNYFLVSSEIASFEKFFSNLIIENDFENPLFNSDNKTFARYNLTAFYPILIASAKESKKDVFKDNFTFISSLNKWDFKLNKDNSLVLDVSFDSLSVFKYLKSKVELLLNKHLTFNIDSLLEFPTLQDSIKEGRQSFYYEDGKLKTMGFYKNGLATGFWRFYYPNGNLNAVIEFADNHANGKCIVYSEYKDALMHISCSFENGKLNNQFVEFHKNGRPSLVVTYRRGEINSIFRFFYTQSTIFAEVQIGEGGKFENIKFYTLAGDFLDINNLSTARNILVNYEVFVRKFNR